MIFTVSSRWKYPLMLFVFVLGINLYYYKGAINNFFIWDDFWFLMNAGGDVHSILFGYPSLRILSSIFFWISFKLFGFNYSGYTMMSIAIHSVNIMLVYAMVCQLFNERKFAFLSAAVYATMAVYSDAILWKSALATLVNLTFYSVVLILYLKGRENFRYAVLSLTVFFFAMFNKEEIASIPLVILFIELVIFAELHWQAVLKKLLPYAFIISAYIAISLLLSKLGLFSQEQFERLAKFRPLHSLLGGLSAFIVRPDGFLLNRQTLISAIVLAVALPVAVYMGNNRKVMGFGLAWAFLTFLPQSYSNLTQYTPKYLFNSISRHLYLPSVGAAIFIAAVAFYLIHDWRGWRLNLTISFLLFGLVAYNAPLVHARNSEWGWCDDAVLMQRFLTVLKIQAPAFENGAHILVDKPCTGRAYMFRALRAYYQNNVVYVNDPTGFDLSKAPAIYRIESEIHLGGGLAVIRTK